LCFRSEINPIKKEQLIVNLGSLSGRVKEVTLGGPGEVKTKVVGNSISSRFVVVGPLGDA
jgi:hypothetical protein